MFRSSKSTHDKYMCCGRNFVFLCQGCHVEVKCANDEEHAEVCPVINRKVDPEPPPKKSIGVQLNNPVCRFWRLLVFLFVKKTGLSNYKFETLFISTVKYSHNKLQVKL